MTNKPDRNLGVELVRATEAAAIKASAWIGRGDKNAADGAAVEAMRDFLNTVDFRGTVVIGEGERDEAPMLYIGERVGLSQSDGPRLDLALDPLEGTTICANGLNNSISVKNPKLWGVPPTQEPNLYKAITKVFQNKKENKKHVI